MATKKNFTVHQLSKSNTKPASFNITFAIYGDALDPTRIDEMFSYSTNDEKYFSQFEIGQIYCLVNQKVS
jgi:hypothetical protein